MVRLPPLSGQLARDVIGDTPTFTFGVFGDSPGVVSGLEELVAGRLACFGIDGWLGRYTMRRRSGRLCAVWVGSMDSIANIWERG